MTWLVAGLGNPGDRYATTRHNLGHMVVDELARRAGQRFRKARFIPADVAEVREGDERVVLAKSHAYMNESGPSFASLAKKHDVAPEHVIAVHDEIDLPFAALRIKVGGSTAGHNGLKSLQGALHTPEFVRVRIGVGRPPGRQDPADFVLEPFAKREVDDAGWLVETAADAVMAVIASGVEAAQDRFNRGGPRD
jgi:PTH1 family peptidyl-tRNA hydrolase